MHEQQRPAIQVNDLDQERSELLGKIRDPGWWLEEVQEDYQILVLASASLGKSKRQLALDLSNLFERDADAGVEYLDRLRQVSEKYETLLRILAATQARWLAVLPEAAREPRCCSLRDDML